MLEEALSIRLWTFLADFLVPWVLFVRCRCSCAGSFYPYFVPGTIYPPHFFLHGLDTVRRSPGFEPSELDGLLLHGSRQLAR